VAACITSLVLKCRWLWAYVVVCCFCGMYMALDSHTSSMLRNDVCSKVRHGPIVLNSARVRLGSLLVDQQLGCICARIVADSLFSYWPVLKDGRFFCDLRRIDCAVLLHLPTLEITW